MANIMQSTDNIFKFASVRPPLQATAENQARYFIRNDHRDDSSFLKELNSIKENEKSVKLLELSKKTIDKHIDVLEKLPDFSTLIKRTISDIPKQLESSDFINEIKDSLLSEETKAVLWNLFYAMAILTTYKPEKREKVYDCLRGIHFLELLNKGNKLDWIDFRNMKVIIPGNLFSIPAYRKKKSSEKLKEIAEKELVDISNKVKQLDEVIIEINQKDKDFRAEEKKKSNKPIITKIGTKGGWFGFGKKEMVSTAVEIPEPQNWINLDDAQKGLSSATQQTIKKLRNEEKEDANGVVSAIEKKMYDLIKSYIYSLQPNILEHVAAHPQFKELLERVAIPSTRHYHAGHSGSGFTPVHEHDTTGDESANTSDNELSREGSALKRGIRPTGIADLKIVRQTFKKYAAGEIAHIENILASEERERVHIATRETEETIIIETEQLEEQQKDLQTTERFELQKESEKITQNELNVGAGFSVAASYGPVKAEAYGDFSISMSSSQSENIASNFAKEVIDRSVSKIMNRAREERTRRTLERFQETNSHKFNNSGAGSKNISGIYRWVDKYYEAQIVNYGKRLMIELIVPEPAAFYKYSQEHKGSNHSNLTKPEPPGSLRIGRRITTSLGTVNLLLSKPLTPQDLNKDNYLDFIGKYNVQECEPYPQEIIRLSTATAGNDEPNVPRRYFTAIVEKLKVTEGYVATKTWGFSYMDALFNPEVPHTFPKFRSFLGGKSIGDYEHISDYFNLDSLSEIIPLSILGFAGLGWFSYNVNIVVECKITKRKIEEWQIKTYTAIMNAYENALSKYNESVAASEISHGIHIEGKNPDLNRRIEQDELKRAALRMITNDYAVTRLANVDDDGNPTGELNTILNESFNAMSDGTATKYPAFNIPEAIKEGTIMQFFEQAFEWDNMTYRFYPYFFGREKNWTDAINTEDTDTLFAEFLKAGAARVLLPVRPAYQDAMQLYLATNIIWNGGSVPIVDSPLYISLANELRESTDRDFNDLPKCDVDSNYPCKEGEPWEVKIPTSLVYLQPNDLDLNGDSLP